MIKKWMIFIGIFMINSVTLCATAAVYRTVDSKGVVTFSDQPGDKSALVTLPESNVATLNSKTGNTTAVETKTKKTGYTLFEIESPKDQDTIQNAPNIVVSIKIKPELQQGDTIQVLLDGKAVAPPSTSTTVSIPKTREKETVITRGLHTLSAVLYDAQNKKITETAPITIFVHYASVLFPVGSASGKN